MIKEDVQILVAPDLSTANALSVLQPILESSENNGQDLMAVVGADGADAAAVAAQAITNDRSSCGARAISCRTRTTPTRDVALPGHVLGGAGRRPDLHAVAALEPDEQDAAGAQPAQRSDSPTASGPASCRTGSSCSSSATACAWCAA